eukprot:CAMPEP_0119410022 /NCGR_PEP_ID=MMETSP1335-20130426/3165_1 /TAXON_ID=259385 /ORGANISM="Chrysoculter rhomboideus, Strain RCC1486" /LENGTH=49 /DNA_ID= /DNA_START= /DNA_END= /DNA_ORIENTATION=
MTALRVIATPCGKGSGVGRSRAGGHAVTRGGGAHATRALECLVAPRVGI